MPRPLALVLAALLVAGGCAPASTGDTGGITIAASPWPLAWLAAQVAPEATVVELAAGGQDAHDVDLSPSDRALLQRADVVLHVGVTGYQPQVERAAGSREGPVVTAVEAAPQLLRHIREPGDDHADDHAGDALDPHVWFDPRILAASARSLGEALAAADPGGAAAYRERAGVVAAELDDLAAALTEGLSSCRRDVALVSHGAYGYLLRGTGARQVGIAGASGHDEVSPARLAELVTLARIEGLTVVLAERGESRAPAEALAREAGVRLVEVDPLEAPPEETRAQGLPTLLRRQAEAFAEALECRS